MPNTFTYENETNQDKHMNYFSEFMAQDWVFFVFSLSFLLPAATVIRNFLKIKTVDYFLFSSLFVVPAITGVLMTFLQFNQDASLYVYVTGFFNGLVFATYTFYPILLRNEKIKPVHILSVSLFLIVFTLFWNRLDGVPELIYRYSVEIWRIVIGIMIIQAYSIISPVVSSSRTKDISRIWFSFAILSIITGLIFSIGLSLWYFSDVGLEPFNLISGLVFISYSILFIFMGMKYPEAMLISKAQVLRILDLYDTSLEQMANNEESGIDWLERYISSIPQNLDNLKS